MQTKQLVIRSAVTIVATGLSLLSSGNSEASGRGPSGMRMSGARGGMHNGAMHQGISSRGINRAQGTTRMAGRNSNTTLNRGRDDRGHGGHERGDDHGRGKASMITSGERQRGDDHGRRHERGDDKGKGNSITRGEREPGDDHGRHHEPGDDNGGR